MHSIANTAQALRITKTALQCWCRRRLVIYTLKNENNRRIGYISPEELERIKAMMYPHGMPKDGAYPLTREGISEALNGCIKASWLPHFAEWGLLQAGRNPSGVLVIRSEDIEKTLATLNNMGTLRDFCQLHSAAKPESVKMARKLLAMYQNPA